MSTEKKTFDVTVTYVIRAVDRQDAEDIANSVVADATNWLWRNSVPEGDVVRIDVRE